MKRSVSLLAAIAALSAPAVAQAAPLSGDEAIDAARAGMDKALGQRWDRAAYDAVDCSQRKGTRARRCYVEFRTGETLYKGFVRVDRSRKSYAVGGAVRGGGRSYQVEETVRRPRD